jgi:hypothetical protein
VENVKKFVSGEYLDRKEAANRGEYKVDVIHANNVLAHVADLHGAIEGIKMMLKPDGVAIVETHYVRDLFEKLQFDCIYHEHLCYYSVNSIQFLFGLHGMTLHDVERLSIHGGSLRLFFKLDTYEPIEDWSACEALLREEETLKMDSVEFYKALPNQVYQLERRLTTILKNLKKEKKKVAVYGVTAKSTTLLNCFGIDKDLIDYAVDATPKKQGLYTPGTHIPVQTPGNQEPDYYLLLAWNFKDEILKKEKSFRDRGGKFIIPIPELEIV